MVGYDGARNVKDGERSMVHKKKTLVRQPDPPSKWPRWTGFRGKTAWDWMDLLIVPIVLLLITVAFTVLQDARQQQIEDQRARQAQQIENQRAEAERELAKQRAQDEALQAYLDQMSNLLLEKDLRSSDENSEVRTLARARTFTVLSRLDGERKASVVQFLYDARLINKSKGQFDGPIVSLSGADLRGVNLYGTYLKGVVLGTYPAGQEIPTTFVIRTDLRGANLGLCDLQDAELGYTDLNGAIFDFADLYSASLYGADLTGSFLRSAHLENTNLLDASMERADLTGAVGKTNEQLEQKVSTLEGATMPDGQKYEDWLKSKDRGEGGKNGSSS